MIRKMSVAGSFYPYKGEEIISTFEYFHHIVTHKFPNSFHSKVAKALIVPHAGYVYSGFSANLAYRNITWKPKSIVVIGPSHKVAFDGVSMVEFDAYETPFGSISADKALMQEISSKYHTKAIQSVHIEHSTEVQFPFIKHYFPYAMLVELVYGQNPNLEKIIEYILSCEDVLLLISTDLSHFYDQEMANILDTKCIKAVENQDIAFLNQAEACGKSGVKALLSVSKKMGLQTQSIDYRTSGDITGDKKRVVGYYSAMVY